MITSKPQKIFWVMLIAWVLLSIPIFSQSSSGPWENPNSGFDNSSKNKPTSSNDGGYDRIEKVTKSSGTTTENGKQVSGEGNSQHKSFVDGYLNSVADKITGVNGSAQAWSWSKSWKVGPDGKPMEVKESYHEGSLNFKGEKDPKSQGGSPSSNSGNGGTSPTGGNPVSGGGKSSPTPSPANITYTPSPKPAPPTSSGGGTPSGGNPSGGKASPNPSPIAKNPGIELAPQKKDTTLPPKMVALTIEDLKSHVEQPFKSYENNLKTRANPIPEDVRTKIGLELGNGLKPEEVSVVIKDNLGEKEFPNGTFPPNYHHVFRIPSQDKYFARVFHTDPITNKREEKIQVAIPVYKLDFESRTLDSSQGRLSGKDQESGGSSPSFSSESNSNSHSGSSSSSSSQSSSPHSSISSSNSSSFAHSASKSSSSGETGGGGFGNTTSGADPTVDLSDLYADPSASPNVGSSKGRGNGGEIGSLNVNGNHAVNGEETNGHRASNRGGSNQSHSSNSPDATNFEAGAAGESQLPTGANYDRQLAQPPENVNVESQAQDANHNSQLKPLRSASNNSSSSRGKPSIASTGTTGGNSGQRGSDSPGSGGSQKFGASSWNNSTQSGGAPSEGTGVRTSDSGVNSNEGGEENSPRMEGTNQAQAALSEKTSKDNLVSLYLNANNSKVGQSFDFRDNPYPTAKNIDPKTELTFSVDLGKNIDRNSVCVVIYDGLKKVEIPLQTLAGNVFQHQFPQVTEEAYVWIYGNTDSSQFSYKVAIPVSGF